MLQNYYDSADYVELISSKEIDWETLYFPFKDPQVESDAVEYLGGGVWRLFFVEHFEGWNHEITETTIGLLNFDGPAHSDTIPVFTGNVCTGTGMQSICGFR